MSAIMRSKAVWATWKALREQKYHFPNMVNIYTLQLQANPEIEARAKTRKRFTLAVIQQNQDVV